MITPSHPCYDSYLAALFEIEVLNTFDFFGLVTKDADPIGYEMCASFFRENLADWGF